MLSLADHIESRRRDYKNTGDKMRSELRQLASFLAEIDSSRPMVANLDDCRTEDLSQYLEEVQTHARRMQKTLARYTETRAALGALLNLDGKMGQ